MRKRADKLEDAINVWSHRLVGDQDVLGPCGSGHLRFGDCGAFEFFDAEIQMHFYDFRQLVCLDVRPEAILG